MPITKSSLISRRNFTLSGPHDSALINMLILGTSPFMYITSSKWAPKEISHSARSAISNFKTNPCLVVKGRL